MVFELDNDGYPTDETLNNIKCYNGDYYDLFNEIEYLFDQYGGADFDSKNNQWTLVTGGWSGNESIILAIESNILMYQSCWESSHRGGKFVFKIKEPLIDK